MKLNMRIEKAITEILENEGEVSTYSFARRITGLIESTRVLLQQMEDDGLIKEKSKDMWVLNNKEVKENDVDI